MTVTETNIPPIQVKNDSSTDLIKLDQITNEIPSPVSPRDLSESSRSNGVELNGDEQKIKLDIDQLSFLKTHIHNKEVYQMVQKGVKQPVGASVSKAITQINQIKRYKAALLRSTQKSFESSIGNTTRRNSPNQTTMSLEMTQRSALDNRTLRVSKKWNKEALNNTQLQQRLRVKEESKLR